MHTWTEAHRHSQTDTSIHGLNRDSNTFRKQTTNNSRDSHTRGQLERQTHAYTENDKYTLAKTETGRYRLSKTESGRYRLS